MKRKPSNLLEEYLVLPQILKCFVLLSSFQLAELFSCYLITFRVQLSLGIKYYIKNGVTFVQMYTHPPMYFNHLWIFIVPNTSVVYSKVSVILYYF